MMGTMTDTWPFHYRDNGDPCPYSGKVRDAGERTCPDGCDASAYHYSNDGHPECDDPPVVTHQGEHATKRAAIKAAYAAADAEES